MSGDHNQYCSANQSDSPQPAAWQNTHKPQDMVAAEDWNDLVDPIWHWMFRPLYADPMFNPNPTTVDQETAHRLVHVLRNLAETARDMSDPQFSDPERFYLDIEAAWETLNLPEIKPIWDPS
jgi:hypothetical protein